MPIRNRRLESMDSDYICGSCGTPLSMPQGMPQLPQSESFDQGIIIINRNGNFCKGTWVIKVIADTKVV